MSELLALSSRQPASIKLSLSTFAQHRGADDGWGVAFYDTGDVRLYKEPELAAESEWLPFIQQRCLSASLFISHNRHTTRGVRSLPNTQPFSRELGGRGTFLPIMVDLTASNAITPVVGNGIGRSARPIQRSHSASCWSDLHRYGRDASI
jgi:glutamine phosphoribosylpyrophosphate amidotransferase